jgi:hypothetical protein
MTRAHRATHRIVWIVLALALGVGLALALFLRAPARAETPAAISEIAT